MKKILFLGFHHRTNDPRLVYREMELISRKTKNLEIFMIQKDQVKCQKNYKIIKENIKITNSNFQTIKLTYPLTKNKNILIRLINKFRLIKKLIEISRNLKPDIIQASAAGELPITFFLGRISKSKLIYDSHEDYISQILDYQGRSFKSYIKAFIIFMYELVFIRFFNQTYCTDGYLYKKYKKWFYCSKNVGLMRNYPIIYGKILSKKKFIKKNKLKIVYIGSINKYKGLIECANYVEKFNLKYKDKKLTLDVYSQVDPITEELKKKNMIKHIPYINYLKLIKLMPKYDIGVCLWLPIKKYYRNLPLKNFDYMAAGLPIITSNFGNLKNYINLSHSGICINPRSYEQFEKAILKMYNPKNRKKYSQNGINYAREEASFQIEGKKYVDYIKKITS